MNKKGISLIEILVSSILIALLITGLMNVVISGRRWLIHSRSRSTASQLGKTFLGQLYQEVTATQWMTPTDTCLYSNVDCPIAQSLEGITYTPTYSFPPSSLTSPGIPDPGGNPFGRIRKAVVTISWTEHEP